MLEKVFLEMSKNSEENTCGKFSFLIKLQTEATASDLSRVFSWRVLVYFISTEMKKGKYPVGVQVFTFLFEYWFVWRQSFKRNLTDGNLIRECV